MRPEGPLIGKAISHPIEGIEPHDIFLLARQLKTPVWVFDVDNGHITQANSAACEIWEAETEAELKTRDLSIDMSVTVKERLAQYQADFLERDVKFREAWTL